MAKKLYNPFSDRSPDPEDPFPDPFRAFDGYALEGTVIAEPSATDSLLLLLQSKADMRSYAISKEDVEKHHLENGDRVSGILSFNLQTTLEKIPCVHDGAIQAESIRVKRRKSY